MTIECVNSVLKSDYNDFKICIIDNDSEVSEYNKLCQEFQNSPHVKVVRTDKNLGYAGGVNYGLEQAFNAGADYFLIMNNDTIIDKNAMKELLEVSKRYDDHAIISGKVYHYDKPDIIQYAGSYFVDNNILKVTSPCINEKDIGQCEDEKEMDMLDDIFWLIPKNIYQSIGPYPDCYFLYAEQADYALQAVKKGFKLILAPKAKLWHKGSLSSGDGIRYAPKANFWRKKSLIIYFYRNLKPYHFITISINILIKSFFKYLLSYLRIKDVENYEMHHSTLIGYLYGLKWILDQKPDDDYNPFIIKPSENK